MANELIIMLDDIGLLGIESYAKELGAIHYPKTPNISALEAAGRRWTRAYTNAACSSSRCRLLTGRHAFRSGMGDNANLTASVPSAADPFLPAAFFTTHNCANIGKTHLFSVNAGLLSPLLPGSGYQWFDRWEGVFGNINPNATTNTASPLYESYWFYNRYRDGVPYDLVGGTTKIGAADGATNRIATNYATTHTADAAIAWALAQPGDWLMHVSFNAPHSPLHKPPTLAERVTAGYGSSRLMSADMETICEAYEELLLGVDIAANNAILASFTPPWPSETALLGQYAGIAAYYAMIEAVDTELGRMVTALAGEVPNIFLIGDNGPDQNVIEPPFNTTQGKNTVTELGTRTFLITKKSNQINAGQTCNNLITIDDIWRTIMSLEVKNPATFFPGITIDGIDFAASMTNNNPTPHRTSVYVERFSPLAPITSRNQATVTRWEHAFHDGIWKLSCDMPSGPAADTSTRTWKLHRMSGGDFSEEKDWIGGTHMDVPNLTDAQLLRACLNSETAYLACKALLVIRDGILPPA